MGFDTHGIDAYLIATRASPVDASLGFRAPIPTQNRRSYYQDLKTTALAGLNVHMQTLLGPSMLWVSELQEQG